MLTNRSTPVTVTEYDTYPDIQYRDGTLVERVHFTVSGEGTVREMKLDRGINGDRPKAGQVVELVWTSELVPDAKIDKNGRAYPCTKEKRAIVGFHAATAAARAAA